MRKALVIEDSEFQSKNITLLLEKLGFQVYKTGNGKEALRFLSEREVDILFVDLLMPVMGGIELMTVLNRKNVEKPYIVITSDIQETTKEKCFNLGCRAVLGKPIKKHQLSKVLSEVLNQEFLYEE